MPAGVGLIWLSVGKRPGGAANFTWEAALRQEGQDGAAGGITYPSKAVGGTLNPGPITVLYGTEVRVGAGVSFPVSGYVATNSQLTAGGTITAQIQYALSGSGSWLAAATSDNSFGEFDYQNDGTRASGALSGSFTNGTGAEKVYDLRMVVSKSGGSVQLTQSETFFKAGP